MNKIEVGVVGCGFIAKKRHIPSFLRMRKDVRLSAVCDANVEQAKAVSKQFGIPHFYSRTSDMLSAENLDIVDVCTPPETHAAIALQAIDKSCNVLLEKPMAPSLEECDKMIDATKKSGVKLSVMHNQNFYRPFIKAKKLVEKGAIGKIVSMRVVILNREDVYIAHPNHWVHNLPGGVISEIGPHAVYMSLAFLEKVKNVNVIARKQSNYPWVSYDDFAIDLVGENLTSSIQISHTKDCNASEIDLFGERGILHIDLQSMLLIHFKRKDLNPATVASSSLNVAGQMIKGVTSNVFRKCFGMPILGHDLLIEQFVRNVAKNAPAPVTPEEGRETIRVLNLIVEKLGVTANSD